MKESTPRNTTSKGKVIPRRPYYHSLEQLYSCMDMNLRLIKANLRFNKHDEIARGSKRTIDSIPGNEKYCCIVTYPDEIQEILLKLAPIERQEILTLVIDNRNEFKDIIELIEFMVFISNSNKQATKFQGSV